jgi:PKD repeat protein
MAADPDSVDLTNGGSVQFSGTSADIITGWSWDFGDGNSSTEAQPVHSYTQPGTYVISLTGTSGDGCSAYVLDTVQVTASDISHVFTAAGVADRFLAVPNPVSGQLTVYLDTSSPTPVEIRVLDLTGRTVKVDTTTARPGGSQAVIDMRDLPGGLYVLTVRMGSDSLYSQRLIKL